MARKSVNLITNQNRLTVLVEIMVLVSGVKRIENISLETNDLLKGMKSRMLSLESIMKIILYVIDNGMDNEMSVSVNFYKDNVEVSAYPVATKEE